MKRIKDIDLVKWLKFIFLGGFLIVILYFLYSVIVYKPSTGGGGAMDEGFKTVPVLSVTYYDTNKHISLSKELFNRMVGWGSDNQDILDVIADIPHTDFVSVYNAFGSPVYDGLGGQTTDYFGGPLDLVGWLRSELSDVEFHALSIYYEDSNLF